MLFDTHTHVDHARFDDDRAAVLERALSAGVSRLMIIGTTTETSRRAVALAEGLEGAYAAIGVHPHDAAGWDDAAAAELRRLAAHPRVKAIGEIGLDFHYNYSPAAAQFIAFRDQIALARELGLPIVIHNREADADVLRELTAAGAADVGGIMHCWSADWATAQQALDLNFVLGIGGSVTFPRNDAVRDVARRAPAGTFVLETDCPFLAPVPHRGRRNEPAYVQVVAEYVANLRGVTAAVLAQETMATACRVLQVATISR